jgi:phage/plasmid primase-like uncharacterized protein
MVSDAIDFTPGEVSIYYAARLPKLHQRAREWRGPCPVHHGKDDNFAVDSETGRWFCHSVCGRGGDILSLEQELKGTDFRVAKSRVFLLLGRVEENAPREDLRRLARRRATVETVARDVAYWRYARMVQLERRKAVASEANDLAVLSKASRELYMLETDAGNAVSLYHAHLLRDPAGAADLIDWARRDERHAQAVTATVVLMLARAEAHRAER